MPFHLGHREVAGDPSSLLTQADVRGRCQACAVRCSWLGGAGDSEYVSAPVATDKEHTIHVWSAWNKQLAAVMQGTGHVIARHALHPHAGCSMKHFALMCQHRLACMWRLRPLFGFARARPWKAQNGGVHTNQAP